jgi:hypothetical protein
MWNKQINGNSIYVSKYPRVEQEWKPNKTSQRMNVYDWVTYSTHHPMNAKTWTRHTLLMGLGSVVIALCIFSKTSPNLLRLEGVQPTKYSTSVL